MPLACENARTRCLSGRSSQETTTLACIYPPARRLPSEKGRYLDALHPTHPMPVQGGLRTCSTTTLHPLHTSIARVQHAIEWVEVHPRAQVARRAKVDDLDLCTWIGGWRTIGHQALDGTGRKVATGGLSSEASPTWLRASSCTPRTMTSWAHISLAGHKDVVRLHVSVHNAQRVQPL